MKMREIMQVVEDSNFPMPSLKSLGWRNDGDGYSHPMYPGHNLIPADGGTFKHVYQGNVVAQPINAVAANRSVRNFTGK